MKLTVTIPILNCLRYAMPMFGCLKYTTSEESEWLILDNGSTENVEKYITEYARPKRLNYVRNEDNPGLITNNNDALRRCETELLCLLHNDCFIYEKNWDQRIISYFEQMPDLGIAGFFGAQGCMPNGGRIQYPSKLGSAGFSNMLEAEIHGMRMGPDMPWRPAAIFDSFCMVFRVKMLKECGGFDTRYQYHHFYDRDTGLESIRHGYKNIVVNVPCHHGGGYTSETPAYREWLMKIIGKPVEDLAFHDANMAKFTEKWMAIDALPLYVNDDFSLRRGRDEFRPDIEYKGDNIMKGLK